MSKKTILNWWVWLYSLGASVIGGVAQAGAAWMGMVGAEQLGVTELPSLNLKSLGVILLANLLINLFLFLKQSPLPKPEEIEEPDAPKNP
jgi:hypothetical protein